MQTEREFLFFDLVVAEKFGGEHFQCNSSFFDTALLRFDRVTPRIRSPKMPGLDRFQRALQQQNQHAA